MTYRQRANMILGLSFVCFIAIFLWWYTHDVSVWEELLFETIPTEAHDLPVKALVTEREIPRFGEKERKFGVPAPLVRGVKRAGRKLKATADRLHITEYAQKGAKQAKDTAVGLWRRFFRKGEADEAAKAAPAAEQIRTMWSSEAARHPLRECYSD